MPFIDRVLPIGRRRIAYRDSGAPAAGSPEAVLAPPVILLHGLGGDGRSWLPVADDLVATGRRVLVPDLRGHGRSDRFDSYRADDFVGDVVELARAVLPNRSVDLVGHSFGGMVASLTAMSPTEGELVRRVVLEDTPIPPRFAESDDLPPIRRHHLVLHWILTAVRDPRRLRIRFDRRMLPDVRSILRGGSPQWWDGMAHMGIPVQIVDGGTHGLMDRDRLAQLQAILPNGRVATVDVGHVIHRSAPERYLDVVRSFLD